MDISLSDIPVDQDFDPEPGIGGEDDQAVKDRQSTVAELALMDDDLFDGQSARDSIFQGRGTPNTDTFGGIAEADRQRRAGLESRVRQKQAERLEAVAPFLAEISAREGTDITARANAMATVRDTALSGTHPEDIAREAILMKELEASEDEQAAFLAEKTGAALMVEGSVAGELDRVLQELDRKFEPSVPYLETGVEFLTSAIGFLKSGGWNVSSALEEVFNIDTGMTGTIFTGDALNQARQQMMSLETPEERIAVMRKFSALIEDKSGVLLDNQFDKDRMKSALIAIFGDRAQAQVAFSDGGWIMMVDVVSTLLGVKAVRTAAGSVGKKALGMSEAGTPIPPPTKVEEGIENFIKQVGKAKRGEAVDSSTESFTKVSLDAKELLYELRVARRKQVQLQDKLKGATAAEAETFTAAIKFTENKVTRLEAEAAKLTTSPIAKEIETKHPLKPQEDFDEIEINYSADEEDIPRGDLLEAQVQKADEAAELTESEAFIKRAEEAKVVLADLHSQLTKSRELLGDCA